MTEKEVKSFINVVTEYFSTITGVDAQMGIPFIKGEGTEVFDYTGVIGISGSRRGGVYYTADRNLLASFASFILGEGEYDDDTLYDLVGEMINTIAGNMRETFGSSFMISVPIIMKGKLQDIVLKLTPPVFIIPIEWNGFKSHLAVGLE